MAGSIMQSRKEKKRKKSAHRRGWVPQVAALPYQIDEDGNVKVLLITSRHTKRFIVPKGWPQKHKSEASAAGREADEEAGVRGLVSQTPIGKYFYWKELTDVLIRIGVSVYPLAVAQQLYQWPESAERKRIWVNADRAMVMISDVGMIPILKKIVVLLRQNYSGQS